MHIPFDRLPMQEGRPDLRLVHDQYITQEEYDQVGWIAARQYVTDKGIRAIGWVAPLAGLLRWSRIVHERREADFRARAAKRAADDEWSDQIVADIEARR